MRKHLRKLVWGIFLLTPILLHPVYLTAQTTVSGSGGGGGITIGTTPISGGATTEVLYNAAGVVSSDSGFTRGSGTTTISNGVAAVSPLVVMDNVTPVFTIADGGSITATSQIQAAGLVTTQNNKLQIGSGLFFYELTTLTPDAPIMLSATTSNSLHYSEFADNGFDFNNGACGTSACTDPGLIIHSAVQDTTQYNHLSAWGQAGGGLKALTAAAATALVRIPIAQGAATGGSLRYSIIALDATDQQVRSGEIKFAVVNKAGTETCTVSAASEAADGSVAAVSVGTLTYGIACTSNAADTVDLTINAVSSLTETTLQARYFVTLVGAGQPARQ